jgi:hypothetical protein
VRPDDDGRDGRPETALEVPSKVGGEFVAFSSDLETVRDVLGHSNVTTTALYLHTVGERKRRAARQLKLV